MAWTLPKHGHNGPLMYQIQALLSHFLCHYAVFCGLRKINSTHSLHRAVEPMVHESTKECRGGERHCRKDTLCFQRQRET